MKSSSGGQVSARAGGAWTRFILWLAVGIVGCLVMFLAVLFGSQFFNQIPREEVLYRPLVPASSSLPAAADPQQEQTPETGAQRVDEASPADSELSMAGIVVRFLDGYGQGVSGVQLEGGRPWAGGVPSSGPDGVLRAEREWSSRTADVRVSYFHPYFAADVLYAKLRAGKTFDLGDVHLRAGGSLSGRVVDGAGNGLANCEVEVEGEMVVQSMTGGMRGLRGTQLGEASTHTDAQGLFQLRGLLAGDVRVDAESEDGLHRGKSGWVEIRAGQESHGLVVVAPMSSAEERIEGVVLDPQGDPLPMCSMQVRYSGFFGGGTKSSYTGEDGRFRVIVEMDTGHDFTFKPPSGRDWNPIHRAGVRPGTLNLRVQFQEADHFELFVHDQAGAAVEYFVGGLVGVEGDHSLHSKSGHHPGGRVRLRLPDGEFRVLVDARGFAEFSSKLLHPRDLLSEGTGFTASLQSLPGISGRILADGRGCSGAQVYLQRRASGPVTLNGFPVRFERPFKDRTEADSEGRFRLELREAGEYVVRAVLPGLAPAESRTLDLEPESGLAEVTLELSPGGAIRGTLFVGSGENPAGAVVAISRGDCWAETRRLESDGEFHFQHLMPGDYLVRRVEREIREGESSGTSSSFGSAHDETPSNCTVEEGRETRFDLIETVDPICELSGRLELVGQELTQWRVTLHDQREGDLAGEYRELSRTLDAAGHFQFRVEGEGARRLVFDGPGQVATHLFADLELEEGRNEWSERLEGARLTLDNLPQALSAYVSESDTGLFAMAMIQAESGGSITLEFVPAGSGRLVRWETGALDDPFSWPTVLTQELEPGADGYVRLP